jgi:hypothetical protein
MATVSSLGAEIAELRNQHQPLSTPSPAPKKVCPSTHTPEPHLSKASLVAGEETQTDEETREFFPIF